MRASEVDGLGYTIPVDVLVQFHLAWLLGETMSHVRKMLSSRVRGLGYLS